MNELVQLVQQKTGLWQDAAEKAIDTVLGFIKQKLPAPIGAAGAEEGSGMMAEANELVGGILGKKAR